MAPSARREGADSRCGRARCWKVFRLNQHRDDASSGKAEGAVTEHLQDGSNRATVGSKGDPGVVIATEDIIKELQLALLVRTVGLSSDPVPKFIVLVEPLLELVGWVGVLDVSLVAAVVASVKRDAFSQEFLDSRNEGIATWEVQSGVSNVCSSQTTRQWRDIV